MTSMSCPGDGEDSNEAISPLLQSASSDKWSPLGGRRVSSPKHHRSRTTSPRTCEQRELESSQNLTPAKPSRPPSKQHQVECSASATDPAVSECSHPAISC